MLAPFLLVLCFNQIICQEEDMDVKIVGGEYSHITDFPYTAFLGASCDDNWTCGASILNQNILLTAAHCIYGCHNKESSILVICGSAALHEGRGTLAQSYKVHENFSEGISAYDIGLLKLKEPLLFSKKVRRVAVMMQPPYNEMGKIAGWGKVDEFSDTGSTWLKHITQKVMRRIPCEKLLGDLPIGVICGGILLDKKYISNGDSGSGLVVQGYIQIGIVSFKRIDISLSIAVYTDVGYFYKWIKDNAIRLFCGVSE